MKELSDIGLVGLGVMGQSLALNMESKGLQVSVYNYIPEVTASFMAGRASGLRFFAADSYAALVASLSRPRKVFLMVTAGDAVDQVIGALTPLLEPGDIIIDGGNSHFPDTARRLAELEARGLLYVGTGVSGGEEGALKGPSMMPGGSAAAWPQVKDIFQSIAAKAPDGTPCCDWVGPGGAGHFVKMVHNGIEYGDIQLICECYQIMRDGLGMDNPAMQAVFTGWGKTELDSYLISITADILGKKDADGRYILDYILDAAGQKGTGKWTVMSALDAGVPLSLIGEAVFARCLSAQKEERVTASAVLEGPGAPAMPGASASPDTPAAMPDASALMPGSPVMPGAPTSPDTPAVMPDASALMPGSPVMPGAPTSPDTPAAMPDASALMPGSPVMPGAPTSPDTPAAMPDASALMPGSPVMPGAPTSPDTPAVMPDLIGHLQNALLAAKIISYAQGFALMRATAQGQGWPLDYSRIAGLWRGGCIIRSIFLDRIKEAFHRNPALENLMLDPYFAGVLSRTQESLRMVVAESARCGIPVPALSAALSYYDGYRCPRLGTNLLQAQRDYFGAHTYERTDRPRGEHFHTDWK